MSAADFLNSLSEAEAREALHRCCGSGRWVDAMVPHRPWASDEALYDSAALEWEKLDPVDWLEAFSHHPRIGDQRPESAPASTRDWSSQEQAGARDAGQQVLARLEELNRRYEERFGHVFLICATGRSGEEMLAELERRLLQTAEEELREAAGEQRKITQIRLAKLSEPALVGKEESS